MFWQGTLQLVMLVVLDVEGLVCAVQLVNCLVVWHCFVVFCHCFVYEMGYIFVKINLENYNAKL